jgi:PD-(D/E)XK endonuclease
VELNRKAKGDLAELNVAADLRARGYTVALPFGEDWDFNLIVCTDGRRLERVQVKYARSDDGMIVVRPRSLSLTNGKVRATKRYTASVIDWLASYAQQPKPRHPPRRAVRGYLKGLARLPLLPTGP